MATCCCCHSFYCQSVAVVTSVPHFPFSDCTCAGRARRSSGGGPHVGGEDVLLLPRCHQSLPHNGVPPRRWVVGCRLVTLCGVCARRLDTLYRCQGTKGGFRISVRPRKNLGEKSRKRAQKPSFQLIAYNHWHSCCDVYCEQNGDTLKHWVSTGPTASQSTFHDDDYHGPTIMRKRLCSSTDDFPLNR